MFQTVYLSIIRSLTLLFTQQYVYVIQVLLTADPACKQSTIRSLALYTQQNLYDIYLLPCVQC